MNKQTTTNYLICVYNDKNHNVFHYTIPNKAKNRQEAINIMEEAKEIKPEYFYVLKEQSETIVCSESKEEEKTETNAIQLFKTKTTETKIILEQEEDSGSRRGFWKQQLYVKTLDDGGGDYIVIRTHRWAINDREEWIKTWDNHIQPMLEENI